MKPVIYYALCLSLVLSLAGNASGQNGANIPSNDTILFPSHFFDVEGPLNITLKFDIRKFNKEKPVEGYLPASLVYSINDSVEVEKQVKIKARGIYRKDHCYFAPYWLNIKDANISDDVISNIKKIKVVSHCQDYKLFSDYLLKEFVAYKLYNKISDLSFKVRLLRVKYIDTGNKNKESENWAFMIEPEDLLAKRLEAYPYKSDNFRFSLTDSIQSTIVSVFQYMIGNTDFSTGGRHNVKLITLKDFTKPGVRLIPYDFDFSGLVNAHYAAPAEELPIKSVTERFFYGMCRSDETFQVAINVFLDKEQEIFEYVDTFEYFDNNTRKYVRRYLEEFYGQLKRPDFIKKHIRPACL